MAGGRRSDAPPLPIADCRLPIADCRLPIADCRSRMQLPMAMPPPTNRQMGKCERRLRTRYQFEERDIGSPISFGMISIVIVCGAPEPSGRFRNIQARNYLDR
jgi:hypothetical protein